MIAEIDGVSVARGKVSAELSRAQFEVPEKAAGAQVQLGWAVDPRRHGEGIGSEIARELLQIARELGAWRATAYR